MSQNQCRLISLLAVSLFDYAACVHSGVPLLPLLRQPETMANIMLEFTPCPHTLSLSLFIQALNAIRNYWNRMCSACRTRLASSPLWHSQCCARSMASNGRDGVYGIVHTLFSPQFPIHSKAISFSCSPPRFVLSTRCTIYGRLPFQLPVPAAIRFTLQYIMIIYWCWILVHIHILGLITWDTII